MGGDVRGTVHPCCSEQQTQKHGVTEAGEAPPNVRRCARIRETRGDPYVEESGFGSDIRGYTRVISFCYPCSICIFKFRAVDTESASYHGRHPQRILSQHEHRKKVKYIEAFLERRCHLTIPAFSVDEVMGKDTKTETKKLSADLSKNGTGNTWQHSVMYDPVSPWA